MRLAKLDLKLRQRLVQDVVKLKVNISFCFFCPLFRAQDAHHK